AVAVQPGDAIADSSVDGGEDTADQHPAIRLQGHGIDANACSAHAVLEGGVEAAIVVEASDAIARYTVDRGEDAANENLAIGLFDKSQNRVIDSGGERRVEAAVAVEASDVEAADAVDEVELSTDQHLAVSLDGHGVDDEARCPGHAILEGGVECAVGVE